MKKFFVFFVENFFNSFRAFRKSKNATEFSFPAGSGFQVKQNTFEGNSFEQETEFDDDEFSLFQRPSTGQFFE